MATNPSLPPGIHKEKQILVEIGNSEKQLWALIHSKGLLHSDAQDLYQRVCSGYERKILDDHTQSALQDVEYSLWKFHYKYIDEFRKRIKKGSVNAESTKSGVSENDVMQRADDHHLKGFKSFLSEAIEFYRNLIVKLRKHYGVPEEALFYKKGRISTSVEPDAMRKCQYICHRCLVCMGDLSRYRQQYENSDIQNHNWSVAATHYLEATRIWPDSGNPQNQLAVLATYIGDEFLALYHCVRSLAVKEPFPDAWDNLILLFEKNRSSHLHYVSREFCFDSFIPFGRSSDQIQEQSKDYISNWDKFEGESNHLASTNLWSYMVRSTSFFFIESSLEEYPVAFASTIRELDKLMELGDSELKTVLESYQQMDLTRRGPFRSIQVVSILIFVLKNLIDKPQWNQPKERNDQQQLEQIQLALASTFSTMGRFVERCLRACPLTSCPLLPAVLVFVEWSVSMLDAFEAYATDQKSRRAMAYFFGVFIELLNHMSADRQERKKLLDDTPLWEDYELRGFAPVASAHVSLDFSGNWEHIDNFESGIELRIQRISKAAIKIANRSNDSQRWIKCDKLGRKFYAAKSDDLEKKDIEKVEPKSAGTTDEEPNQKICQVSEETGKQISWGYPVSSNLNEKSVVAEDEEVILFRPLIRYNSEPLYPSISTHEQMSPKDKDDQSIPSDECLRRATSLLMAQNPAQCDPWGFHADIANFRSNTSLRQQETSSKESNSHNFSEGSISRPPSLSAWVLDSRSLNSNREKGTNGVSEHRLHPIDELATSPFAGLSINKTKDSIIGSADESSNFHSSSATYSLPVPSAPLLPDNAPWFTDVQPTPASPLLPENPSHLSGYSHWSYTYGPLGYVPSLPAFANGYPPARRMTSSEWLRWYREHYNPDRGNINMQPAHASSPGNPESFLYPDAHRFNQFDRWGNPISSNQYTYIEPPGPPPLQPSFPSAFGASEQKACLFYDFQRPGPYGCGSVTDIREDPQPLLEYLKEKEWRLQRDPTLKGPTFMGN